MVVALHPPEPERGPELGAVQEAKVEDPPGWVIGSSARSGRKHPKTLCMWVGVGLYWQRLVRAC